MLLACQLSLCFCVTACGDDNNKTKKQLCPFDFSICCPFGIRLFFVESQDVQDQFGRKHWLYKSSARKPWLTVYRASTGVLDTFQENNFGPKRLFLFFCPRLF